ncbi:toxin glutamine deamidase domain-containing protein [Saccharopolyspora sp. NPDC002376]
MVFRQLVQKLMQMGSKKFVKELLEKVLKEGLQKLISKSGLLNLGKSIATNVGTEMAMDAGIQGVQMAKGDRSSFDFGKSKDAALGGVGGGIAGHLVNGRAATGAVGDVAADASGSVLGTAAKGLVDGSVRGAAEGALGTVAGAAMTGDLGNLSASDVLTGASSGAVDGGIGGTKGGFEQVTADARAASASVSSVADSVGSVADSTSSVASGVETASNANVAAPGGGHEGGSPAPGGGHGGGSLAPSGGAPDVSHGGGGSPASGLGSDAGPGSNNTPSSTSAAAAAAPESPGSPSYGSAPGPGGMPPQGPPGQHPGNPGPGGGMQGGGMPQAPMSGGGGMPGGGGIPGGGMASTPMGPGGGGQAPPSPGGGAGQAPPNSAPGGGAGPRGDFAPAGGRQGGFAPQNSMPNAAPETPRSPQTGPNGQSGQVPGSAGPRQPGGQLPAQNGSQAFQNGPSGVSPAAFQGGGAPQQPGQNPGPQAGFQQAAQPGPAPGPGGFAPPADVARQGGFRQADSQAPGGQNQPGGPQQRGPQPPRGPQPQGGFDPRGGLQQPPGAQPRQGPPAPPQNPAQPGPGNPQRFQQQGPGGQPQGPGGRPQAPGFQQQGPGGQPQGPGGQPQGPGAQWQAGPQQQGPGVQPQRGPGGQPAQGPGMPPQRQGAMPPQGPGGQPPRAPGGQPSPVPRFQPQQQVPGVQAQQQGPGAQPQRGPGAQSPQGPDAQPPRQGASQQQAFAPKLGDQPMRPAQSTPAQRDVRTDSGQRPASQSPAPTDKSRADQPQREGSAETPADADANRTPEFPERDSPDRTRIEETPERSTSDIKSDEAPEHAQTSGSDTSRIGEGSSTTTDHRSDSEPHDNGGHSADRATSERRPDEDSTADPEREVSADRDSGQRRDHDEPTDGALSDEEVSARVDEQKPDLFGEDDTHEVLDAEAELRWKLIQKSSEYTQPAVDQSLDFCLDPNYRAPKESFDALDDVLCGTSTDNKSTGPERTRCAYLAERINERIAAHPEYLGSLSKQGAMGAHAYSTSDVYTALNTAARTGTLSPHQMRQLQAIVSGINELQHYEGPSVRGLNLGNPFAAALAAGHYQEGKVTVEPSLTSVSMGEGDNKFVGDVELQIDSKTARRLQELASQVSEREGVLMPMSQLYVHSKELVIARDKNGNVLTDQDGNPREKWVIKAEEIVPGDPRYLSPEDASRQVAERQKQSRLESELAEMSKSKTVDSRLNPVDDDGGLGQYEKSSSDEGVGTGSADDSVDSGDSSVDEPRSFDGTPESPAANDLPTPEKPAACEPGEAGQSSEGGDSKITRLLDGLEEPQRYGAAESYGAHDRVSAGEVPPLSVDSSGNPDWNAISHSTEPITTLPAIHSLTAHPEHGAAYIAANHPELGNVNPNFHTQGAFENGWQTNCTRSVVTYAQRLLGFDVQAEPVLPSELAEKGTPEYVQSQLGGQWEHHGTSYDSIIQRVSQDPVGSHAVIGVVFDTPKGPMGHVALVTNTPEGVAFIDPQSGRLMDLPYPPIRLDLLPYGSLPEPGIGVGDPGANQHSTMDRRVSNSADLLVPDSDPPERPDSVDESGETAHDDGADDEPGSDSDRESADDSAVRGEFDDSEAERENRIYRSDGPWFGQHVNPLRTVPPVEEDEGEPLPAPPIAPVVPGRDPSPSWPTEGDLDAPPTIGTGTPDGAGMPEAPQWPEMPEMPGGPKPPGWLGSDALPSMPMTDSGSVLGNGGGGLPDASSPASASSAAGGLGGPGAGQIPPGSGSAGTGSAANVGSAVGGRSAAAEQAGAAMGGMPGAGSGGGTNTSRERWRPKGDGSVTYNRERTIPADAAAMYLRNQEATTLLSSDGRQVEFRKDAAVDLGAGHPDDMPETAVMLRYEAVDPSSTGVPFDEGDLGVSEFTGSAEIYVESADGSEVLLGTFNAGSRSWTPTRMGRKWLDGGE